MIDRFGQITPKLLLLTPTYGYKGKTHDIGAKAADLLDLTAPLAEAGALGFTRMPCNAPLFILFSSGRTGVPKCILHSIGGTLLQHIKEHCLQSDLRPGDRLFFFTT